MVPQSGFFREKKALGWIDVKKEICIRNWLARFWKLRSPESSRARKADDAGSPCRRAGENRCPSSSRWSGGQREGRGEREGGRDGKRKEGRGERRREAEGEKKGEREGGMGRQRESRGEGGRERWRGGEGEKEGERESGEIKGEREGDRKRGKEVGTEGGKEGGREGERGMEGVREGFLFLHLFVQFRPLVDWMSPTHTGEGHRPY